MLLCPIFVFNHLYTYRPLTTGQRGEIFEVNGNRVAVVFDNEGDTSSEGSEKKPKKQSQKPNIHWIDGIFTS